MVEAREERGEWKGFSDGELKNLKQSQQTSKLHTHVPNGPQRNTHKPGHYGSCKPPVRKGQPPSTSSSPAEQMPAGAFFHKPSVKDAPLKIHAYPVAETRTKSSVSETKASVSDTKASVSETKASVSETKSSVSDTKSSVSETKASVSETKSSVTETKPSVPGVKPLVPSHSNVKDQTSRGQKASTETEKRKDEHPPRPSVERGTSSELDDVVFSEKPLVDTLELMQKQQREIEAANKKKRALVQQTLMERYKQSQMEAKTLQLVKRELDHVDDLVTRDVSVLRDKIEDANRDYNLARKRYELAEAEFIAAKIELHKTSELKELLSEHLCAVIQQNEARKARKLAELLQTLNLEPEDSKVSLASAAAVVQKTPTPGLEIWPRDRLRNSLSSPKGTPSEVAVMKSELESGGSTTESTNSGSKSGGDHNPPQFDGTDGSSTPQSGNSDSAPRSGGDLNTAQGDLNTAQGDLNTAQGDLNTAQSANDSSSPPSGNSSSGPRLGIHSSGSPQDNVPVDESVSDCGKANFSILSTQPPSTMSGDSGDSGESQRDSYNLSAPIAAERSASREPAAMDSSSESDRSSTSPERPKKVTPSADQDMQAPPTTPVTPPTTQTPPTTLETPPTGSDS